ncbi:MAG: protein kinase [Clostridia bacterium]|nr:protein kinase [Clostridia bacterium]
MNFCIYCMQPLNIGETTCPACGKAQTYACPEHHLRPGTMLAGHYLLGAALGSGGFGITYIARDTRLEMTVAIKELYPVGFVARSSAYTANVTATTQGRDFFEKGKSKFLEEAKLLASLDDEPGIVDVIGFFEENNTAYIVMKYLRGESLKQYLRRAGKLPLGEAYRLLRPVMESLMAAHEMNVVHRDIAPDNIIITRRGAKLLDFGAAREVFSEDERSLSILVKRGYSPYEQYTKTNQGPWTDVYALCATLYACVAGRPPEDALKRMQTPGAPLNFDGLNLSPQMQAALIKGLAMLPEQRYQSIRDLMQALDDAERTPQPVAKPVPVAEPIRPAAPPKPVQPQPAAPPTPVMEPTRRGAVLTQAAPTEALKPRQTDHTKATEAVLRGAPDANTPAKADKPEGTGKSPVVKIIAIVLAVVLAVGGVVWMVNKRNRKSSVSVGDYITFGTYEQDNNTSNGKEAIEWLVLKKEGNKALVISKYALDCQEYNTEYTDVTWSTCTLRTWLNDDFYNDAFRSEEQSRIQMTTVTADKNPMYGTDPGDNTQDRVFLLSIDEANTYFKSDEARKCAPTAYAEGQGAWTNSDYTTTGGEATCWWLRSPGYYSGSACCVNSYGYAYERYSVTCTYGGVRPALWINLGS